MIGDILAEDQRLALLRFLAEMPEWAANASVLTDAMRHIGHRISRDKVLAELQWLAEQGLLRLRYVENVLVCTLTERGLDVSSGNARCPGVKRPGPSA